MTSMIAPKTILSEAPVRREFLPFALPDLDDTELHEVRDVLDSGWITTGAKARQFEREFAAFVDAAHAVAVNSCTAALHLALEAIGLKRGDLVLTTPYTFAATAEVIRYFDAIPVFVDIDPTTMNMDVAKLAQITDALMRGTDSSCLPPSLRTSAGKGTLKAIVPVHFAGYPCDMDAVRALAERHGLAIIEDAAHAIGAKYKSRLVGSASSTSVPTAVCFSFYATKCLTTGEGGMICTSDQALADRCRMMSLHGISKDAWKRYSAEGSWQYEILAPGFKYNMTDLAAALGVAQMRKEERMRRRRTEIADRYNDAFHDLPALEVPFDDPACRHAWHLYPLRLNLDCLPIDRARFVEELKARAIGSSVHFIPLHTHPYYRQKYGYRAEDFPVAYQQFQREVSLPIYSKMTEAEVQRVIEAVVEIVSDLR